MPGSDATMAAEPNTQSCQGPSSQIASSSARLIAHTRHERRGLGRIVRSAELIYGMRPEIARRRGRRRAPLGVPFGRCCWRSRTLDLAPTGRSAQVAQEPGVPNRKPSVEELAHATILLVVLPRVEVEGVPCLVLGTFNGWQFLLPVAWLPSLQQEEE